ncbi:MAG: alpha/beta hydrolase-fold protein [Gemmatimonadota bacterium]
MWSDRAGRIALLLLTVAAPLRAQPAATAPRGTVRTDTVWSQALGIRKQLVVYLPPSYGRAESSGRRYPVAVYLHGAWGSEVDWTAQGRLAATMDSLVARGMREMIVVMPDGDDGWWTTWHGLNDVAACRRTPRNENADTYCVPWPKYDDYVVHDVLAHVDSAYRTVPQRASRAIAGLSMGGYGAISIAARNPRTFAVAASHSGVLRPALMADSSALASGGSVIMRDARTRDELRATSGGRWERIEPAFGSDSVSWTSRDPSRLVERALQRGDTLPALFVDVGTDDYLLAMSRSFRDNMAVLRVPLRYAEWSGRHDWAYWRAHLPESLQFIAERLVP